MDKALKQKRSPVVKSDRRGFVPCPPRRAFALTALRIFVFLLSSVLLYCRVFRFPFGPMDDYLYVVHNPIIQSLSAENIANVFLLKFAGNYSPLHILAYALEFAGWGLRPSGYHAVNALLHGVNAWLVMALCLRLGMTSVEGGFAGLLFLVHPVQVESVAWISELKTLLAAAFFLGSLILAVRDRSRERSWPSIGAVLLFLASSLSKPSAIAFPLLVLLFLFVVHGDRIRNSLRFASPFFAVSLFTAMMAMNTQEQGGWGSLQWHGRLASVWSMAGGNIVEYAQHLLFPFHLSNYYYIVPEEVSAGFKIGCAAISLWAVWVTLRWTMKRRLEGFLAAWFFVMLLPNANLFPLDVLIADRYLYLPCIGLFALFSRYIVRLRDLRPRGAWTGSVSAASIVLIAAMALNTFVRSAVWKDPLTYFEAIAKENPAPRILTPLVLAYREAGRENRVGEAAKEAIASIEKALARQPNNWELYLQAGTVYEAIGDPSEAKTALLKALEIQPDAADVLLQLADIYMSEKNFHKALELLERDIRRYPHLLKPRLRMVEALAGIGDYPSAMRAAEEVVQGWPNSILGIAQLADLSKIMGDTPRAVALYRRVIELDPDSKLAQSAGAVIQRLTSP